MLLCPRKLHSCGYKQLICHTLPPCTKLIPSMWAERSTGFSCARREGQPQQKKPVLGCALLELGSLGLP